MAIIVLQSFINFKIHQPSTLNNKLEQKATEEKSKLISMIEKSMPILIKRRPTTTIMKRHLSHLRTNISIHVNQIHQSDHATTYRKI